MLHVTYGCGDVHLMQTFCGPCLLKGFACSHSVTSALSMYKCQARLLQGGACGAAWLPISELVGVSCLPQQACLAVCSKVDLSDMLAYMPQYAV